MGEPKWKSTEKCFEAVMEMETDCGELRLQVFTGDDYDLWCWRITCDPDDSGGWAVTCKVEECAYEDEAANAGYRHAYKYYRKEKKR